MLCLHTTMQVHHITATTALTHRLTNTVVRKQSLCHLRITPKAGPRNQSQGIGPRLGPGFYTIDIRTAGGAN